MMRLVRSKLKLSNTPYNHNNVVTPSKKLSADA